MMQQQVVAFNKRVHLPHVQLKNEIWSKAKFVAATFYKIKNITHTSVLGRDAAVAASAMAMAATAVTATCGRNYNNSINNWQLFIKSPQPKEYCLTWKQFSIWPATKQPRLFSTPLPIGN